MSANDEVFGTSGNDVLSPDHDGSILYGLGGNDTLINGNGDDILFGGDGRDTLRGGGGDDVYEGGAGFDVLIGGPGADRFVWGMDALDGNRDLLYYFSAAEGHVIDLSAIAAHYGWNQSQAEAAVSVTDGPKGALLSVTTPDLGTISLIDIRDAAASEVAGALLLVSGPPPDTGDDDGNMALALPDTIITAGEEGAVEVVLSGLDADATAVITISDGTNSLTSAAISANGSVFFDLSGFDDGAITTEVTATDAGGNATTRQGPGLTLDTAPDTSADADGNLTLTAPDTEIDAFEAGSVQMTVTGIDDDADAVVEISDGVTTLTRALAADGSVSFDLTGLQDGPLTSRVVVNDTTGNTASVDGPALTLDTVTPPPAENAIYGTSGNDTLIPENTGSILYGLAGNDKLFNGDGDDILYGGDGRDTLRGGGGDDVYEGGAGFDVLHGGPGADRFVWGMDALDGNRDLLYYFSAAGGHVIDLSAIAAHYGWNQSQAEAAVSVTDGPNGALLSVTTPDLGTISLIDIRDAAASEVAGALLLVSGPPPDTGDDDGNMALALPDTIITAGEEGAVEVVLSGLDADATAVITISDGTNSLTSAAISANGSVFFDLSGFDDGAITTEVTATDAGGNATTRQGPGLTLDTAPDTSADADGNLTLTAPDTEIDAFEAGSVQMTVTGIDDDADAVVEISDGVTTLTRALAADGSVSFDLTGLQDGPLTSRVVVNDTTGNTASVDGPALTLDTVTPPPAENAIYGTSGNDTLIPENTGSILYGLAGNDKLFNGDGDDILYGGDGRDTLRGGGGDDVYEGGAGFDVLHGGPGADRFVWGMDALDGNRDLLYYFSAAGGHVIDLSAIAAHYGWNQSQAEAAVSVTDGPNGALLSVTTPDLGTISLIDIRDAAASDITPATGTLLLTGASADDDANMALALPDTIITAGEEGAVEVVLSGLDADATAVITISDGTNSLTSAAISADGSVFFDLSGFNDGAVTTAVTANDSEGNTTIRSGPGFWIASSGTLSLAGEAAPVVIDLAAETYATAARVLAIGDSLTVGWRDRNDPAEINSEREGFRQDLFERIAMDGGWYDYVGPYQNGPAEMLDRDHAGVAGWEMAQLISGGYFTDMLENQAPDVTLLMLGTNDLDDGTADIFGTLSNLISDLSTAVEQFYAVPGNDERHLVVSTLAPLIRRDNEPEHAYFANEGYSIIGGAAVVGDAGNGTYMPGIKATIAGLQASHSTLLLFENPHAAHPPVDTADQTDHLTGDEVHWSASAYAEYADALAALLISDIGLAGGTFAGSAVALPGIVNVTGTEAGDRISGDATANRLDGGGGNDLLEGRGGADHFVFDEKSLSQTTPDRIADFDATENDMIDVSAITSFFGWTLSQAQVAFELVAVSGGVDLTVTESGNTTAVVHAAQITLGDISLADDVILV